MTVLYRDTKIYPKLNIRRIIISKINYLIYHYKSIMDIESIYFNEKIDGLTHYKLFPHFTETDFASDWYSDRISGKTLLKVLECLRSRNFYGYCRTTNNQLVKIKPKKNVQ